MKVAAKTITVYGTDGKSVIGKLNCGDAVRVLEQAEDGTLISYITGFIKAAEAEALLTPEEWERTVDERSKFLSFIAAQVGALYVRGAQGQLMTPELIKKLEDTEANIKRVMARYEHNVKNGLSLLGYDCSGLIVAHLLSAGLISKDKSANGLYRDECGDIAKEALLAGDLVFKKEATSTRMHHVGVYMGDGTVVHAKGRDYGVIRNKLSSESWNRFGRLKCFGGAAANAGYTRLLKYTGRPYQQGDDVRAVQKALEDLGFSTGGIDGLYGPKTQKAVKAFQTAKGLVVDGIVGPVTWAALFIKEE